MELHGRGAVATAPSRCSPRRTPGGSADPEARPPLPLFADLERDAFVDLVRRMVYRERAGRTR